jgi:Na+-transporting NADH:ubiquinone oxidoreductase subunit B
MARSGVFQLPDRLFLLQQPMLRVCYALTPLVLASMYLFGWRPLVLLAVVFFAGIASEALFTFREGKPVTSAVFVTCMIFTLSLPPAVPFWMAVVGTVVGVSLGKMVFGGFGQNVFNPAMVGRCFLYITFPVEMTNQWPNPFEGGIAGFGAWTSVPDAVTQATPLVQFRHGGAIPLSDLFLGNSSGSLGETSALLIVLGAAFIILKKAAPWRLAVSCLIGGLLVSSALYAAETPGVPIPVFWLLSGSFLFGCAFVVTEPVSGAKTRMGQWIYGFMVGGLTMILRGFSNFSEGVMFSVLLMNAFVPLLDQAVRSASPGKRIPK